MFKDQLKKELDNFIVEFEKFQNTVAKYEGLTIISGKNYEPVQRKQAQKVYQVIQLLDKASSKYQFDEEQLSELRTEVDQLFNLFTEYTILDEKQIELYDKYKEINYDDKIAAAEKTCINVLQNNLKESGQEPVSIDDIPVLQGLSSLEMRAWERELNKIIDAISDSVSSEDFFKNIFTIADELKRKKFDEHNVITLYSLLPLCSVAETSQGKSSIAIIAETVKTKLLNETFEEDTSSSYLMLIDLFTNILLKGELSAEDQDRVVAQCKATVVSMNHELLVIHNMKKYDPIVDIFNSDMENKTPVDIMNEQVDTMKKNIELMDLALKRLRNKEAISKFLSQE